MYENDNFEGLWKDSIKLELSKDTSLKDFDK